MDVFISPLGSPEKPYFGFSPQFRSLPSKLVNGLDSVWIGSRCRRRREFPWSEKAVVIFFAFVSHFSEVKRRNAGPPTNQNDVGMVDDVASKLR